MGQTGVVNLTKGLKTDLEKAQPLYDARMDCSSSFRFVTLSEVGSKRKSRWWRLMGADENCRQPAKRAMSSPPISYIYSSPSPATNSCPSFWV